MAGKVGKTTTATAVSPGGSLISDAKLQQLYATMVQCRMLTERALRLRGEPRSAALYAASMGQEAIATGCAINLQPGDTIALAPHNSIASLVKGVPLDEIVAQMYTHTESPNIIMPSATPGSQFGRATSVARANKLKKKSNVVIVLSDKATTTLGSWHEALALAANKNLPMIFVLEDNPWPPPTRLKANDVEKELTGKAQSYGFPIITVDANDVVAVYRVAYESVERIRQGGGPVLVEAKPYRPYNPTRRSVANSTPRRSERDPLIHMQRYLRTKGLFTLRWKNQLVDEFSWKLDAALKAAKKAHGSPQK